MNTIGLITILSILVTANFLVLILSFKSAIKQQQEISDTWKHQYHTVLNLYLDAVECLIKEDNKKS